MKTSPFALLHVALTCVALAVCSPGYGQSKKDRIQVQQQIIDSLQAELVVTQEQVEALQTRIGITETFLEKSENQAELLKGKADSLQVHATQLEKEVRRLTLSEFKYIDSPRLWSGEYFGSRTMLHCFSDPLVPDTFCIYAIGKDWTTAQVYFEIKDHRGKVLHKEELFLDTDGYLPDEEPKREDLLGNLSYTSFMIPAIREDEEWDEEYHDIDESTWTAIKGDPNAVGFWMPLGWEYSVTYAFDRRTGKVVNVQPGRPY